MSARKPLRFPITLATINIVLIVALTVGWVVLTVTGALASAESSGVYWALLSVGTTFLVLVLVGVVIYLALTIKAINLNQRQSNFIDSVTHELKSPIASLKLYLQTLGRLDVTEQQRADFYRFMLDDIERLDRLINHLLEAASVDHEPVDAEVQDLDLAVVLKSCAETVCSRYRVPQETVRSQLRPATIRARPVDVDMLFRNLLDNAVKYAGNEPEVTVDCRRVGQQAVVRISDNGRGISPKLRRKIFGRFVRLGRELEREKPGTGLGLYIVRTLVKRLRGRISVHDRAGGPGTTFEVHLPLSAKQAAAA